MSRFLLVALVPVLASAGLAACSDPVHDDAVRDLGSEAGGVPPGPNHRPGQPCLTCHGGAGPADLELAVGGTVFNVRGHLEPAVGVTVTINDGDNQTQSATSNEVGNFYILKSDWDISFPLDVSIHQGTITRTMTTRVGRDGGCASCHRGACTPGIVPCIAGDPTHMPGVFLKDQ